MNEQTFPGRNFSPIQVLIKLLRSVFPIAIRLMDDRTSFVQEVPRDLQFFHDFGHCSVERWIQTSRHSDVGILSNLGASSNLYLCMLIRHQLLVMRILVAVKWHPLLLSFVTQTSPAQQRLHRHLVTDPASLFTDHRMSGLPIRLIYKPFN